MLGDAGLQSFFRAEGRISGHWPDHAFLPLAPQKKDKHVDQTGGA